MPVYISLYTSNNWIPSVTQTFAQSVAQYRSLSHNWQFNLSDLQSNSNGGAEQKMTVPGNEPGFWNSSCVVQV